MSTRGGADECPVVDDSVIPVSEDEGDPEAEWLARHGHVQRLRPHDAVQTHYQLRPGGLAFIIIMSHSLLSLH